MKTRVERGEDWVPPRNTFKSEESRYISPVPMEEGGNGQSRLSVQRVLSSIPGSNTIQRRINPGNLPFGAIKTWDAKSFNLKPEGAMGQSETVQQQAMAKTKELPSSGTGPIQLRDFGKFPSKDTIDVDKVGEEEGGIRLVPEESARPDDVPLVLPYREAMHRLHNAVLILEKADRSGEPDPAPSTSVLRVFIVKIQSDAKGLAKNFKKKMRDLTKDTSVDTLKDEYIEGMEALAASVNEQAEIGEAAIGTHGYLAADTTLKEEGTTLWRDRWLKAKLAVNNAMTGLWRKWKGFLKKSAADNNPEGVDPLGWKARIPGEDWDLFYGGSLAKGYKGPPKQHVRFLASKFDVDANMDAPAIAEYLISKGEKVDRGQLDPEKYPETRVKKMDGEMDKAVKVNLVSEGLAKDATEVNDMISEPFETRVNASEALTGDAGVEVKRSMDEQDVRDLVTNMRHTDPHKLAVILDKLKDTDLVADGHLQDTRTFEDHEIALIARAVAEA